MEAQVTTFGPKFKRGVCSVCGEAAYDGRATKCATHKTGKKATTVKPLATADAPISQAELTSVSEKSKTTVAAPPRTTAPVMPTGDAKKDRAAVIKRQILDEGNPLLLKGFAFTMKQIPAENFFTLEHGKPVPTDITADIPFSEWEAAVLGRAVAELEGNPALQAMQAMAGPVVPYAVALGAAGVLALHAFQAAQARAFIINKWAEAQAGQAAQVTAEAPTMTPGNEGVMASVTHLRPQFTAEDLADTPDEESLVYG